MKKTYLYMVVCAAALMMVGCAQNGTTDANGDLLKAEKISIGAKIANPEQGRTGLDEDYGDGIRAVYWEADDQVALIDDKNAVKVLSLNPDDEMWGPDWAGYTMFYGEAIVDFTTKKYPAVYPASAVVDGDKNSISLNLPEVQTRVEGGDALMYATNTQDDQTTADGAYLEFVNLVGYLELQVVGDCSVSEVVIESASKKLSGAATLVPVYEADVLPTLTVTGSNVVTLVPAEAVALDASTPTSLFVALPADTYPAGDLTIKFITTDGIMEVASSQEHVLEVSHIKPLTMTVASNVQFVDLTAGETYANTFIVEEEGWYKFAAKTRGGLTEVTHPKTGDVVLSLGGENADAGCAWETADGMITNVNYDATANEISFYYNGVKGNAMICLMENELSEWNWHIWGTDKPEDQTVGQNVYMDRNLGAWATPANVDDGHNYLNRDYDDGKGNIQAVLGLMYQWGRPIPFPQAGRVNARFIADATDTSHSVYQREPTNSNTCADLWVETTASLKSGSTAEDVLMGYTQKFYFPGGDLMSPIYHDRSGNAISYVKDNETVFVPWTNKWYGINSTSNAPLATAINKPFSIYGTAAGDTAIGVKYWCKELFEDSFDFGSTYSLWNYGEGAQSNMVFDVCPHGYKVLDGAQALADFGSLNYTWRSRYNSGETSSDGLAAGTTRTVAAYATATDGSFVWIPWTGGRVFYGGLADWDCINWWCSSNNSDNAVVAWKQSANTSTPHLINGLAKAFTAEGAAGNQNWETAIATCFATRCQKIQ